MVWTQKHIPTHTYYMHWKKIHFISVSIKFSFTFCPKIAAKTVDFHINVYYKCTNDQVNLSYWAANHLWIMHAFSFRFVFVRWKFECGSCCVRSHAWFQLTHMRYISTLSIIHFWLVHFVWVFFFNILSVNIFRVCFSHCSKIQFRENCGKHLSYEKKYQHQKRKKLNERIFTISR